MKPDPMQLLCAKIKAAHATPDPERERRILADCDVILCDPQLLCEAIADHGDLTEVTAPMAAMFDRCDRPTIIDFASIIHPVLMSVRAYAEWREDQG